MSADQAVSTGGTHELVAEAIGVLLDTDTDTDPAGAARLADIDGWDSVNALRLLAYLERRLDAPLDYERFHTAVTVADVVAVVTAARPTKEGRRHD